MSVMKRAKEQITQTNEMGYVLVERFGEDDLDSMHTFFIGSHDQLNLYQIWYNHENKTQLEVEASFVPVVRVRVEDAEPPMIAKNELFLAMEDLQVGAAYAVDARNFSFAIWDGTVFHGVRFKMGKLFVDTEQHWSDDNHFGTVRPLRRLE